ncbi:hypothetical protein HGP16_30010 [Rhizobium sp. P40RR-XXII]|uniref:hypothetical protein n=1 Tax=Rhizobium sp. P40RR-XXII TaxID=2726739 RepID=UPI001456B8EC|nr:hypothetical protein [Rhizobium sp. P40RR-XXII]NLS20745.1 hypothetical protein [Rhizobium sp. P40RR-XXII]
MAQTTLFVNSVAYEIPPDGTAYFVLGPANFKGAVTVTAHPSVGILEPPQYMEVIQMAVRTVGLEHPGEPMHMLDIVFRNNSHGSYGTTITNFDIFTSVVA